MNLNCSWWNGYMPTTVEMPWPRQGQMTVNRKSYKSYNIDRRFNLRPPSVIDYLLIRRPVSLPFPKNCLKAMSIVLLAGVVVMAVIGGCSSDEIILSESKYHPSEWLTNESPDYHGHEVFTKGLDECHKCHGVELAGGLAEVSCYDCHGEGKDNCVACHGGQNDSTGAPPIGLRGETDAGNLAVGAHDTHVRGLRGTDGIGCEACHTVPATAWDSTHFGFDVLNSPGVIDSIAEITWGGIAGTAGIWNRETMTCENTYCHGNFRNGDTTNIPVWTAIDQSLCGSCHDYKGNTGDLGRDHQFHTIIGVKCIGCHAATVDSIPEITGFTYHVDGQITVKFMPDSGSFENGTCTNPGGCHGSYPWSP